MAEWCGSHSTRWDGSNCYEKGLLAHVLPGFRDDIADIKLVARWRRGRGVAPRQEEVEEKEWTSLWKMESNAHNQC